VSAAPGDAVLQTAADFAHENSSSKKKYSIAADRIDMNLILG
jgi:hypothetical protein